MTVADMSEPVSENPMPPWWRRVWRLLAVLAVVAVVLLALATPIRVVALPLLLALFPAALLPPAQRGLLQRGVPAALAAALLTATAVTAVVAATALAVPMMIAELPRLVDSLAVALRQVMSALQATPLGIEIVSPQAVSEAEILEAFDRLGVDRPSGADLAPLRAA
jgi:predicted PurR-regulated permease PerM